MGSDIKTSLALFSFLPSTAVKLEMWKREKGCLWVRLIMYPIIISKEDSVWRLGLGGHKHRIKFENKLFKKCRTESSNETVIIAKCNKKGMEFGQNIIKCNT